MERAWIDAQSARDRRRVTLLDLAREYAAANEAATLAHQAMAAVSEGNGTAGTFLRAQQRRAERDNVLTCRTAEMVVAAVEYDKAEKELERARESYVRHVGSEPPGGDQVQRYINELRTSQGVRR